MTYIDNMIDAVNNLPCCDDNLAMLLDAEIHAIADMTEHDIALQQSNTLICAISQWTPGIIGLCAVLLEQGEDDIVLSYLRGEASIDTLIDYAS